MSRGISIFFGNIFSFGDLVNARRGFRGVWACGERELLCRELRFRSVNRTRVSAKPGHFRRHRTAENARVKPRTLFTGMCGASHAFEPAFTSGLALRVTRSRAISAASNRRNCCIFVKLRFTKMLGEHPAGVFPKPYSSRGKLFVFRNAEGVSPLEPLCAFLAYFASLRSSASGGLKPFSEEKG